MDESHIWYNFKMQEQEVQNMNKKDKTKQIKTKKHE